MELWKQVLGYEGTYEVSNFGNIKNSKGHLLSPGRKKDGYLHVVLYCKGSKKNILCHRIVGEAFLGPSNGKIINHKNGIKSDNNVSNLERCTNSENQKHAYNILGKVHPKGALGKKRKRKKQ